MNRSELRREVVIRSGGRCEWPNHYHSGDELAHFHSKGSGGNPDGSRNVLSNTGFLCHDAARVSDGEHGSGGAMQYRDFMIDLLGVRLFTQLPMSFVGWERAEALKRHIEKLYS